MPTGITDVLGVQPGVPNCARRGMFITLYGCATAVDVRPEHGKVPVADGSDVTVSAVDLGVLYGEGPLAGIGLIAVQVYLAIHFGILNYHVRRRNAQCAIDSLAVDDRS